MNFDRAVFAAHLQGMVRFPTVSSEHGGEPFFALHRYLEETYPLVHRTLTREVVGKSALLYHWRGTGKSKKLPLLLAAHLDVVPAGDAAAWKHPPFAAHIDDDGVLWGRGCLDSKCNIAAYLDAIELLLTAGFTPEHDVYLAFGDNEELMGGEGAAGQLLHDTLESRGVRLGMVIDEGGGVHDFYGTFVADVVVCEKGYADHELYAEGRGGHAAYVDAHTTLGSVSRAVVALEEHPMPCTLTKAVTREMRARAPFLQGELAELFKDPEMNFARLQALCETSPMVNLLLRTTSAATMAQGAAQPNVLPERASVIVNSRLLPGQTLEDLEVHFTSLLPEGVKLRRIKGHNPPPVSTTDSLGYRLIEKTLATIYPGVTLVPSMLPGGTDSRYYCDLTPSQSVYRFSAQRLGGKSGGAHEVNERIDTFVLADNVKFYVELIRNYESAV